MLPMWQRAVDWWPSQDVGVEVAPPTVPDRLDEVGEVVLGAAFERADEVPVRVEQGRLGDEALRAVDDMAGPELRAEGIGLQPADLLHDRGRAEVVDDHLRVGRLARVLVAEPPAVAEHRVAQAGQPHQPAADVDVVDVVVPQLAVAGVPDPVPVVMELRPREGDVGGRAPGRGCNRPARAPRTSRGARCSRGGRRRCSARASRRRASRRGCTRRPRPGRRWSGSASPPGRCGRSSAPPARCAGLR